MNFYLSAVDDLLRHVDDTASIGLILCKEKTELWLSMHSGHRQAGGSGTVRLTESLPKRLQSELPTTTILQASCPGSIW